MDILLSDSVLWQLKLKPSEFRARLTTTKQIQGTEERQKEMYCGRFEAGIS